MPSRDDEADAWFYDLGAMARRIESNEKRHATIRKRQWIAVAFMVFAFLLLAWRSEVNADAIVDSQQDSCVRGRVILERFNSQQATLAQLARQRGDDAEAGVYETFRIDPLPKCRGDAQ